MDHWELNEGVEPWLQQKQLESDTRSGSTSVRHLLEARTSTGSLANVIVFSSHQSPPIEYYLYMRGLRAEKWCHSPKEIQLMSVDTKMATENNNIRVHTSLSPTSHFPYIPKPESLRETEDSFLWGLESRRWTLSSSTPSHFNWTILASFSSLQSLLYSYPNGRWLGTTLPP